MPEIAADLRAFGLGIVGELYGIDAGNDLSAVIEREIRRKYRIESLIHLFVVRTCDGESQACDTQQ